MQQDKLRDFLKFFRFHLPWFVLSAGFFAVILLSGLFFSSKLNNFRNAQNVSSDQELAISVPEPELSISPPSIVEPIKPEAPTAPSPVAQPDSTPSMTPAPIATVKPTPTASVSPKATPDTKIEVKPITEKSTQSASTYIVKQGDTLWDISVKTYGSGYDYSRISRENKLVNANQLTIGQKLVLPAKNEAGKIASGVSIDLGDETKSMSAGSYKIATGDSLWKIAEQQLGDPYRWTEIYQMNKSIIGTNPDLIYPDVVLKMPGKVSTSAGTSSSISSPNWTSSLLQ